MTKLFFPAVLAVLVLAPLSATFATTYTVDRTDDSAAAGAQLCVAATADDCSLRGAIIKANLDVTADTVVIPAGTYNLTIPIGAEAAGNAGTSDTIGDLDVLEPLTITGAGADVTTVNAGGITGDRVFHFSGGNTGPNAISGLTITGGISAFRGGGAWAFGASNMTISGCNFTGNSAPDGGGLSYDNTGTLILSDSTFSENTASDRGGAIFFESGTDIITNSTFSNNDAGAASTGSAGIDISTGSMTVINSTFIGNTVANAAGDGGAIRNTSALGVITIKNSIFVDNIVGATSENCGGDKAYTSGGHNVSDDATCAFAGTGDQSSVATTILNSTLADNGGTTDTHTLVANSVAIDAVPAASCLDASSAALTEDQRGFERPLTATGAATSCDAGAVEVGCGNQIVEASEACDEAGASTATCDSDCTAVTCGDGTLNTAAGEECEDSNTTAGDGCSATCTTEAGTTVTCGNSIIQATETCDDGNTTSGDGCSSECATETEGLTTDNPDVDFFALTIGEVVSLVAPSPGAVASVSALGLDVAASEDTCDCTWSVTPTTIGTFSDSATCATDLTPAEAGDGSLSVVVDCGADGSDTFAQSLTVANASAAAATTSSGGCSLQTRTLTGGTTTSLRIFFIFGVGLFQLLRLVRTYLHVG